MRVPWAGRGDALRFDMASCPQSVQDVGRVAQGGGCNFPRNALGVERGCFLGFLCIFRAFSCEMNPPSPELLSDRETRRQRPPTRLKQQGTHRCM